MASNHESYLLAPSWDLSSSEIALGSVIADVTCPQRVLSTKGLPAEVDTEIQFRKADDCVGKTNKNYTWGAGVFSDFLNVIPAGFKASYASRSSSRIEYSCESMETQRFTPSPKFIAKAAAEPQVKSHLKIGGLGTKFFIVTGIKIAKGVTIATTKEAGKDITLQVGAEIPTPQIQIGPKVTLNLTKDEAHTQRVEGPIVFAFQVEKLLLTWKREPIGESYVKGAVLGQRDDETDYVIEVADEDLDGNDMADFGLETHNGSEENGEKYRVIFSRV
ncbi:hypothetical protein CFAM422_006178 [Trichoderma lentiforme]|uniref:Uncharacterized protein n=1 Tax=Trichoderma lentiforme TaxID=1567552 RepID=A0A9P5CEX3_9HYPO|nr:hypothetical protein CFAM422_006178 [Trichoderma lentiforme]